jgi:hypothetical protein
VDETEIPPEKRKGVNDVALGAEVLALARCAVGGGCGASGWRS